MTKAINLQDSILNQVRKENIGVTIHLVNGFQIKGYVKGFDNFTVIMDSHGEAAAGLQACDFHYYYEPSCG